MTEHKLVILKYVYKHLHYIDIDYASILKFSAIFDLLEFH